MFAQRITLSVLLAAAGVLGLFSYGQAQFFTPLEGMEAPEDVTGVDCSMCHGTAAQDAKFPHAPASEGKCESCHQTTGQGSHGALRSETRSLCLDCHADKSEHYPALTCWTSSCHSDLHGSNLDEYLNPSRQEEYPGFRESTRGAEYVGSESCLECHSGHRREWSRSVHSLTDLDMSMPAARGCESCHGPGSRHWGRKAGIGVFGLASARDADAACLVCHESDTYVPDYKRTAHTQAGLSCVDCHNPHQQGNRHNLRAETNSLCQHCHESVKLDFTKLSHHPVDNEDPRSGMQCTDCHNPHGGEGRQMLVAGGDQLCFGCHADKQGPFVFPHAGYDEALGRGCMSCHSPHGSNNTNLLGFSGRGLCMQCHTDRANHFPAQNCWTSGCHSDHHGSNGNFFYFGQ